MWNYLYNRDENSNMLMMMIIIMIIFRYIVILNMMQYVQVSDSGGCVNFNPDFDSYVYEWKTLNIVIKRFDIYNIYIMLMMLMIKVW